MTDSGLRHLRVSEASTSDIPSLRTFILDAWREAGPSAWGWTGATEESIQELATIAYLQRLVSNPGMKMLLARDGERIVGFAANRRVDESNVELAGIIVLGSVTGMGIGTALLNSSLKAAAAGGFKEMTVKTERFNSRAIDFYEANGFRTAGFTTEDVDGKAIELVVLRRSMGDEGAWRG